MNILLCCSAGMSTSMLVRKMEKFAQEEKEDCKIWAVPSDTVRKHIEQANVILLGPHIRHMLPQIKKLGLERNIPVELINPIHYGTFNGEEVFKFAKQLINQNK